MLYIFLKEELIVELLLHIFYYSFPFPVDNYSTAMFKFRLINVVYKNIKTAFFFL